MQTRIDEQRAFEKAAFEAVLWFEGKRQDQLRWEQAQWEQQQREEQKRFEDKKREEEERAKREAGAEQANNDIMDIVVGALELAATYGMISESFAALSQQNFDRNRSLVDGMNGAGTDIKTFEADMKNRTGVGILTTRDVDGLRTELGLKMGQVALIHGNEKDGYSIEDGSGTVKRIPPEMNAKITQAMRESGKVSADDPRVASDAGTLQELYNDRWRQHRDVMDNAAQLNANAEEAKKAREIAEKLRSGEPVSKEDMKFHQEQTTRMKDTAAKGGASVEPKEPNLPDMGSAFKTVSSNLLQMVRAPAVGSAPVMAAPGMAA